MAQRLKELDFSDRSHGESISFSLHADTLQSDLPFRVYVEAFEDFAVSARAYDRLVSGLAEEHRLGTDEVRW